MFAGPTNVYAAAATGGFAAATGVGRTTFVLRFVAFGRATFLVRLFVAFGGLMPSFLALRSSRYFLIFDFATSLCSAHTIPNTGAAGF